jgi:hypothetical protein
MMNKFMNKNLKIKKRYSLIIIPKILKLISKKFIKLERLLLKKNNNTLDKLDKRKKIEDNKDIKTNKKD